MRVARLAAALLLALSQGQQGYLDRREAVGAALGIGGADGGGDPGEVVFVMQATLASVPRWGQTLCSVRYLT